MDLSKEDLVILRNSVKYLGPRTLKLVFMASDLCAESVSSLLSVCVEACVVAVESGVPSKKIEVEVEASTEDDNQHDQMEGVCAALELTMQSLKRLPGMRGIDFEASIV